MRTVLPIRTPAMASVSADALVARTIETSSTKQRPSFWLDSAWRQMPLDPVDSASNISKAWQLSFAVSASRQSSFAPAASQRVGVHLSSVERAFGALGQRRRTAKAVPSRESQTGTIGFVVGFVVGSRAGSGRSDHRDRALRARTGFAPAASVRLQSVISTFRDGAALPSSTPCQSPPKTSPPAAPRRAAPAPRPLPCSSGRTRRSWCSRP